MAKYSIYKSQALGDGGTLDVSDGQVRLTACRREFSSAFMGERYVLADIESPAPITFEHGDWLRYRGEVFTLDYEQAVKKQAESYSYGGAYVYNGVKFDSCQRELRETLMLDVVIDDNNIHTKLAKFSFYTETVRQLADRIQANLDRRFGADGNERWRVVVDDSLVETERDHNIEFDQQSVWDALQLVQTEFNIDFVVRGKTWSHIQEYDDDNNWIDEWRLDEPKTIIIGYKGVDILNKDRKDNEEEKSMQYGMGKGLLSLERDVASDQKIITRLRCWGSTRNLPYRYYNKLGRTAMFENRVHVREYDNGGDTSIKPDAASPYMIYLTPPPQGDFLTVDGSIWANETVVKDTGGVYGGILYPWFPSGGYSYPQEECCALIFKTHIDAANAHMVPQEQVIATRNVYNTAADNMYGVTLYCECFQPVWEDDGTANGRYVTRHTWARFRAAMWTSPEDFSIGDWTICVCPNFNRLTSSFFPHAANSDPATQASYGTTWTGAANKWCEDGVQLPTYWTANVFNDATQRYEEMEMSGSPTSLNLNAISSVLLHFPESTEHESYFYNPVYFVSGLDVNNLADKYGNTEYEKLYCNVPRSDDDETLATIEYRPDDPNFGDVDWDAAIPFKIQTNHVRYAKLDCDVSVLPKDGELVEPGGIPDGLYLPNLVMDAFRRNCCDYYKLTDDGEFVRVETEAEADFAVHGEKWVDGYIDSLRGIEKYGIKEGVVIFDNDMRDELKESVEYREIYPSLERLTAEDVFGDKIPDGMTAGQRLDQVFSCEQMDDFGVLPEDGSNIDPSVFSLTTYNVGFNLAEYLQTKADDPKICIKSGLCAGREFEPLTTDCAVAGDGQHYELVLNRVKDENIQIALPYRFANIKQGDRFVITGIKMPEEYVMAAERRVTAQGLIYLSIHDHPLVTYTPAIDNIDLARKGGLGFMFREGDMINFVDYDLGIKGLLAIQNVSVKYGATALPQYEITLKEKRTEKFGETTLSDNANAYNTGRWHQELDWDDNNGVWLDSDE